MDLYAILGIPKNATAADIKKAHRRLVKTHHPDKGGNMHAFNKIQQAYEVLRDPRRRKHYDDTGEIDNEMAMENAVRELVVNLFLQVCLKERNFKTTDIIEMARTELNKSIGKFRQDIENAPAYEKQLKDIRKRMKRNGEGPDILCQVLDSQIKAKKRAVEIFKKEIQIRERALEMIKDYEYRTDPVNTGYASFRIMFDGGTGTSVPW